MLRPVLKLAAQVANPLPSLVLHISDKFFFPWQYPVILASLVHDLQFVKLREIDVNRRVGDVVDLSVDRLVGESLHGAGLSIVCS